MSDIELPHNDWFPREHQLKLWKYLREAQGKRAIAVWHRRAGKDEICLHHAAVSAFERVGNYWHCLPEFLQGRKAIWTAVNPHSGLRRIDEAFPPSLRANTSDNEMFIRFKNGSTWQVIGSDSYNRVVGASAAGVTFSEYALCNPSAWAYLEPMLKENNGWGVFITTPRGNNHAKSMYEYALRTESWFAELLTVDDTGELTKQQLDEVREEYAAIYGIDMGGALFKQEYYCDFHAGVLGAFYAYEMRQVREEKRIVEIEPDAHRAVHRAWDLGIRDDTAIWFFQISQSGQIYLFDCLSTSGASLEWWRDTIAKMYSDRGWRHGIDYVPHDAKVRELGTGRTRVETMTSLGLNPLKVPDATIQDGINAVRRALPLCVFHPRCETIGIAALEQYQREWDDDKKVFRASALHNWCADRADAFRYLALAWQPAPRRKIELPALEGWTLPPPDEPRRGIRL